MAPHALRATRKTMPLLFPISFLLSIPLFSSSLFLGFFTIFLPFSLLTFIFNYHIFSILSLLLFPLLHFPFFQFPSFLFLYFILSFFHYFLPLYHACSAHNSLPLHLSFTARIFLTRLNIFPRLISHCLIDVLAPPPKKKIRTLFTTLLSTLWPRLHNSFFFTFLTFF